MAEEEVTPLMDSIIAEVFLQRVAASKPDTAAVVDPVAVVVEAAAYLTASVPVVATAVTAEVMVVEVEALQLLFPSQTLAMDLIGPQLTITVPVVIPTVGGLIEEYTAALVQAERLDLYTQVVQDHIHQQM